MLLTALGRVLAAGPDAARVAVDLEGHGREDQLFEDVDLSRTVGWFTSLLPGRPPGPAGGLGRRAEVGEGAAARGAGPGHRLRRAAPPRPRRTSSGRRAGPRRQLQLPGPVRLVGRTTPPWSARVPGGLGGAEAPGHGARRTCWTWSARVQDGRLEISWHYSAGRHREQTVAGLAEGMLRALEGIVAHCAAAGAGGRTPSDFPLARLDQAGRGPDRRRRPRRRGRLPADADAGAACSSTACSTRTSSTYLNQVQLVLSGVTDPDALAEAWQQAADANPVLRTRLSLAGGRRAGPGRAAAGDRAGDPPRLDRAARPTRRERGPGPAARRGPAAGLRPGHGAADAAGADPADTDARADGVDLPPRPARRVERGPGLRRGLRALRRADRRTPRPRCPSAPPSATTCAGSPTRTRRGRARTGAAPWPGSPRPPNCPATGGPPAHHGRPPSRCR